MNVIQHLRNLLMQQDAVILPGFGEFTTVDTPASANQSGEFSPPAKALAFNPSIKANDYVLAKYIAEKEEIGISRGNEMIKDFVDEITQKLQRDQTVTIPQIGTFTFASTDAPLIFAPDDTSNYQVSSFGLEAFRIEPQEQPSSQTPIEQPVATDQEQTFKQEPLEPTPPNVIQKTKRRGLWIWLIILTLIITAAIALIMMYPDQAQDYWINLREKIAPTEKVDSTPEPPVESGDPDEMIPTIDTLNAPVVSDAEPVHPDPLPTPPASDQVVIIAGCFGEKANAERMVEKLKQLGFSGASLDGKTASGLYRVAAGYYQSTAIATQAMQKAERENQLKNAWIGERQQP